MTIPLSFSPKLGFAITFSLSFALPFTSHSSSKPFSSHSCNLRCSSSPNLNIAADLLSILGGIHEADRIPKDEALRLQSCLRFIVPATPDSFNGERKISDGLRKMIPDELRRRVLVEMNENEMVWWPPEAVMELARLAIDSGGDIGIIQRALDPRKVTVPDVEGLKKDKCKLTRTPTCHRFADKDLNSYIEFLFELIMKRAPSAGMSLSLSRYDLFHGHLFLTNDSRRLGILFHAREYPAYKKELFPYNLGFCQTGSNVVYDESMNLRNILWLAPLPSETTKAWLAPGALVILDARPGGIIYEKLVPEYVDLVRTIYEDEFGDFVADVNYLNVDRSAPGDRIFIC